MSKLAEEMFIDGGEYRAPALRGAMNNWLDQDWTIVGKSEKTIKVNENNDTDTVAFREFEAWLNRKVDDDWYKDVKKNYGLDEPKEIFLERYNNDEEFRARVNQHVEHVTIGGGSIDEEDKPDEVDEGNGDVTRTNKAEVQYPELYDVGLVEDNLSINMSKMRGLLLYYSRGVDEVTGPSETFDLNCVKQSFTRWGLDRFGSEWANFLSKMMDPGLLHDAIEGFYKNSDEFAELVEEKYKHEPDELEGNSDPDEEQDHPTGRGRESITRYKSKADNKVEKKANGTKKSGSSGSDGNLTSFDSSGDGDNSGNDSGRHERRNPPLDFHNSLSDGSSESDESEEIEDEEKSSGGGLDDFAEHFGTTDEMDRPDSKVNRGSDKERDISKPSVGRSRELKTEHIYHGDCFVESCKLPKNSLDTIVTSPPYYAQRDYDIEDESVISGDFKCDHEFDGPLCEKCGGFRGQLGHEPRPEWFVDHLVDLFDRLRPALKDSGSLWVNLGDGYAQEDADDRFHVPKRSMYMMPQRMAQRLVEDGWVLKNSVIFCKKIIQDDDNTIGSGKPFGGSNRIAYSWEPFYWFVNKESDYWSDIDSIRTMPKSYDGGEIQGQSDGKFRKKGEDGVDIEEDGVRGREFSPMGANIPDVWMVTTGEFDGDHRAVYPEGLVKRPVKMTCPDRVCEECGTPYSKEVIVEDERYVTPGGDYAEYEKQCSCRTDEYEPGVVFDPFMGSGTTGKVASDLNRRWSGIEISEKYRNMALDRIPEGRQPQLTNFGD